MTSGRCFQLRTQTVRNRRLLIGSAIAAIKLPNVGYMDADEGVHPYSFDCPERILAKSTDP